MDTLVNASETFRNSINTIISESTSLLYFQSDNSVLMRICESTIDTNKKSFTQKLIVAFKEFIKKLKLWLISKFNIYRNDADEMIRVLTEVNYKNIEVEAVNFDKVSYYQSNFVNGITVIDEDIVNDIIKNLMINDGKLRSHIQYINSYFEEYEYVYPLKAFAGMSIEQAKEMIFGDSIKRKNIDITKFSTFIANTKRIGDGLSRCDAVFSVAMRNLEDAIERMKDISSNQKFELFASIAKKISNFYNHNITFIVTMNNHGLILIMSTLRKMIHNIQMGK